MSPKSRKEWIKEVLAHADARRDVRVVFMLSAEEVLALDHAAAELGVARGEAIRCLLRKSGALG